MKKIIFVCLAVAALASCNKSEVIEVNSDNAIAFNKPFVDNATKAMYSTTNLFDSFNVYGIVSDGTNTSNIFAGVKVSGSGLGDQGNWSYDEAYKQYWAVGKIYNFSALVGTAKMEEIGTDDNGMPTSVKYSVAQQEDILYAVSEEYTGVAQSNETVEFTFSHLLSKAKFTFKNQFETSSNMDVTVTGIQITNAASQAVVTLPSSWAAATSTDAVVAFGDGAAKIAPNQSTTSTAEMLLIPNPAESNTTLSIEFTVTLSTGGVTLSTNQHKASVEVVLKPGYSYNFVGTLSGTSEKLEEIQFTVTDLPDWTEYAADGTPIDQ